MEKSNKANQIVHEAEITRQHARYKIPATIEIEGKRYKVYDWSVSGVGIIGLPDEIYQKRFVTGKMIFKFDDFETVIDNLKIEFVVKRPNDVVGGRFTELTPQQIAILNQIISAYLAGDIITEDDIIHAVTRANFTQKKEVKTKVDKKKSILVLILLWTVILFLVLFLLYVMYQRTYIVKSENAFFDANMTILRSPSPSYISFTKELKEGQHVKLNEELYYSNIIYGGVKVVKSPVEGDIFKVLIHNNDFRNVGEPIVSILDKNYEIFIVANVLHKDLEKINIGDIARVQLPNGDEFYAKVSKILFPYDIVEQHSRPLENIYNQARNYDRVILKPIHYRPSTELIGSSAVVIIDSFLNKHGWYSIDDEEPEEKHITEVKQEKKVQPEMKEVKEEKKQAPQKNETKNSEPVVQLPSGAVVKPQTTEKEQKNVQTKPKEENKPAPQKTVSENKYCIIAASSPKPFRDPKSKEFLSKFNNARVVKVGSIYEIKLAYFDSFKSARNYTNKYVRKYYKDAFIIKCKEEK